jgi:hypothetical protein
MAPISVLAAVVSALIAARALRRRRLPAQAVIVSPRRSTVIASDGAVRSVQCAELSLRTADLERLWAAPNLENLARTYWRFLSRVTAGLIRVRYGADERSVVFLVRPLTLLRFGAPEYVVESGHGNVRWRIRDGLLVARTGRGRGFLSLDVRRIPDPAPAPEGETAAEDGRSTLRIEVEVANFYPAIAAGFSQPVYEATQSSIHVLVTHAFLRSLASLNLAESKVGRLADPVDGPAQP